LAQISITQVSEPTIARKDVMSMQPDKEWLKDRFIAATVPYISTDAAIAKHYHYLVNVVLRGSAAMGTDYDKEKAANYLRTGQLEQLFELLWPAIEAVFLKEQEKAERMIRDGKFTMTTENGDIVIKSEQTSSSRAYKVHLANGTCTCPHGKKLSYCGLACKHLMTIYSQLPSALVTPQVQVKTKTHTTPGVRRLNLD